MLEIEVKCPVMNFDAVRQTLTAWGARADPPQVEADHYYNAPDRDFGKTDEALRVRRVGVKNRVTYKGPKLDKHTKTRAEIEVSLAEGDKAAEDFCRILECLKYRATAVVRKQRVAYHLDRGGFALEVTLDDVAEVGKFIEVEIQAPPESLEAGRAVLLQVVADLGLTQTERRSYLEMLLAKTT
jgi:adenylate cyclase class 2